MGKALKAVTSIIGLGSAPKAAAPAPVAVAPAVAAVDEDAKKAKSTRAALFSTEGGAAGQELDPTQVKKRQTLLGN